jgi:multiple sugar transport system permease protein
MTLPSATDTDAPVGSTPDPGCRHPATVRRRRSAMARREAWTGLLWVQAWFLGFLLFTAGPIIGAVGLSFTSWQGRGLPEWNGLANYVEMFTDDPLFWQSLQVTFVFALLYLPLSIVIGMAMALLMNQKLRGVSVFRTIYYLPSVLSGVAVAILWTFVFHREYGILNGVIGIVGIDPIPWLRDSTWVLPALAMMQLWGVGSSIIIYLGGLQGIPTELYEVARIDGAGWWQTLRTVTLPMMSPVIFFQVILGLIATFQVFTQAFVMTQGGPDNASLFYALNIYNTAFTQLRLGYASALSGVIFKTSKAWVYYVGEN